MASLHQVAAAIQQAITDALVGVTPAARVGIGWPPLNELQDVVRGGQAAIAVYDQKIGRNTTRWLPFSYDPTIVVPTLTTTLSSGMIAVGGGAMIILGGTITPGDAVSAVFTNVGIVVFDNDGNAVPRQVGAEVVIVVAGDTLAIVAAKLAAAVNADPLLSLWVSAVSGGPMVTLTALAGIGPLIIASRTGNGGTQLREIGRRERHFQIACWTATEIDRQAISNPIDVMLAQAELDFGFLLPDNSYGRLLYLNDYDIEDGTLVDAYRRDFLCTVDYPVTVVDQLFAILAPELIQQAESV